MPILTGQPSHRPPAGHRVPRHARLSTWPNRKAWAAGVLAAATACTSLVSAGAASAQPAVRLASAAPAVPTSLAGVCPNPVEIQTDWTPEAEQGAYYQLAATNGTINKTNETYTAPLIDPFNGKPTGVNVEVLAGGPVTGFVEIPALLTEKPSILMAADDLDSAMFDSPTVHVVGIVAPIDNSLHILMWNPGRFHFNSIQAIGKSNVTVLYGKGTGYVEWLGGAGYLKQSQLDGSYQENPSRFVASGGGVVEQGFATEEPYTYTHQLPTWDYSMAYELTSNLGYNPYSEMGEATPANIKKYAACFKRLVPMVQQAQVNYVENPGPVSKLIVRLNKAYGFRGGPYNLAIANYTVHTLLADRLVENGPSGFGSLDMARVATLLKQVGSVMARQHEKLPAGATASTFATNEFIDPAVKMAPYKGPFNNVAGVIVVQGIKGTWHA
jgi:hypothetical protein